MLIIWLTGISTKERSLIFVGAVAFMWAIRCTRNDLIFEKKIFTSFMQVVFKGERTGRDFDPCYSVRIYKEDYLFGARH